MDIGGWLRSLGLERYEAAFRENEITEKVLPRQTAEDLKEVGVNALGHRRMLCSGDIRRTSCPSAANSRPRWWAPRHASIATMQAGN